MNRNLHIAVILLCAVYFTRHAAAAEVVDLRTLVNEMSDYDALAQWPRPFYRQCQASSYNRESVAPDKPGWFADQDGIGFIRSEQRNDQTEWVMMEHDGPGCLTRIWTPFFYYGFDERTGPNVRVYLDGADVPVVDCSLIRLVTSQDFVGEPFSQYTARAGDLYLPIPYAAQLQGYDGRQAVLQHHQLSCLRARHTGRNVYSAALRIGTAGVGNGW